MNNPKRLRNITNTPQQKEARAHRHNSHRTKTRQSASAENLSFSFFLSFFLSSCACTRGTRKLDKFRGIHTHTHERERQRNMVKVAKTARTFDAVREFVVGFLSFFFLSLSRRIASRRSRSRVSVCGALTVSLSLFLVSFRMRKLYSLRECRR